MINTVRQCSRMNAAACQRLFPRLWPLGGTLLKGARSVPQFDSLPLPLSPVQVGWSRFLAFVCGCGFLRQQVTSSCMAPPLVGLLSIYVTLEQEGSSPSLKAAMLSFIGPLYLLQFQCVCDRDHQIWWSRSGNCPCVGIAAALPRLVGRCSIRFCDRSWCCVWRRSLHVCYMDVLCDWLALISILLCVVFWGVFCCPFRCQCVNHWVFYL